MPSPAVMIHYSATDEQATILPALQEFAARLGRTVFVTAVHGSSSLTPSEYVRQAYYLFSEGTRDMQQRILEGHDKPFILNFFAAPLLRPSTSGVFSQSSLWRTEGSPLVLDYHWLQEPDRINLDFPNHMITYQGNVVAALINEWGTSSGREWLLPGEFVHAVDDGYIHRSALGPLPHAEGGVTLPGMPGAIVCENAAFIPRDVIHSRSCAPILTQLLSHIEPNQHVDPAELERRRAEFAAAEAERERAAIQRSVDSLKEWINNLGVTSVRQAERNVEQVMSSIRRYRGEVASLQESLAREMATLDAVKRTGRKVNPNDLKALRKMLEKGIIKNLRATTSSGNPVIQFETRTLLMLDDRSEAYHLLGRMEVSVNMGTGSVTALNLDRQIDAFSSRMQGPHIWQNGEPCLGNFGDAVAGFLATGDWYAAIELTLAFLESANTDDVAGSRVHAWPYVVDPTEYGYPPYSGPIPQPFTTPEPEEDDEDEDDQTYVNGIGIVQDGDYIDELDLRVGEEAALDVGFVDANGDYDTGCNWDSYDPHVARVNRYGEVEAVNEGTTTIEVVHRDSGCTARITVNVLSEEDEV